MVCAGLLAKKSANLGLRVKPYIKTSISTGSSEVIKYLEAVDLLQHLSQIGFNAIENLKVE